MTDKELLELAAKAAGYPANHPWNAERLLLEPPVIGLCIKDVSTNWNPLTNDGDALRLAVKLGLALVVGNVYDYIAVQSERLPGVIHSDKTDDQYAATRRAIVRAAAEIGRTMG